MQDTIEFQPSTEVRSGKSALASLGPPDGRVTDNDQAILRRSLLRTGPAECAPARAWRSRGPVGTHRSNPVTFT